MAFSFKVRDFFRPRRNIVKEIGLKPGFQVLDYGCGPGSYIAPVAELVGKSGKIYALDVNPLAIQMVQHIAKKKQLTNVETILSDCKTGLPDDSIDVVLLYDAFHDLNNPDEVLEELRRVLKTSGVLSFSVHHLKKDEIITRITGKGLFHLLREGERTYGFTKTV
jgi:ubiquinone/menaquinone biosynthesis C-methylase UbiE